ncbi:MAG: dynamin family protein [Roseobacter sp.]
MNALNATDELAFVSAKKSELLADGMEGLRAFAASTERLKETLAVLSELGTETTVRRIERMLRQLEELEPSVTMIGQIKSGKTSLVNAFVGEPDLLPSDVNPWTSVVTSLHLYPETSGFKNSASFRFFDEDEWDKLISGGGRIGELASRAGADDELERIKQQVSEMREKSRVRLGRKFEVLLGQRRDYGYFDKDLIERFVCLGDDPGEEGCQSTDTQGRFADITKSADLNMTRAALPTRLCIRDTPGVNDTFMMREQITIRAIRDSKICVVVLSAHQALSSADMALIRLISHARSREIIIFVNRIDELSDPAAQIPQIKDSITSTLLKHKGPKDAQILFGSALWGQAALQRQVAEIPPSSALALENWFEASAGVSVKNSPLDDETMAWKMSGLPALQHAISERILQGTGAAKLQRIGASAKNLAVGLSTADQIGATYGTKLPGISGDAKLQISDLIAQHAERFKTDFDELLIGFAQRLKRVQDSFLERATVSLADHLEEHGDAIPWTYDPAGLRVLLSSSHRVLARNSVSLFEKATQNAACDVAGIYAQAFSLDLEDISIALPRAPQVPSPVSLGRTIALDLSAHWWKRWWLQRRGYEAYAANFYDLMKSETTPVISELRDDLAQSVRDESVAVFDAFLDEQFSVFDTMVRMKASDPDQLQAYMAKNSLRERGILLERAIEILEEYA